MPSTRAHSSWPTFAVHLGASLFVVALAASVSFDPRIWVLHALQGSIYVAVMVLVHRESAWGFGAGFAIAALWNGANLFATGFIPAAVHAVGMGFSTGHLVRPVLLLILVGATGHFLMIAGSLAHLARGRRERRQLGRFLGGAVLGALALVLISPLRLRLHEQPLPLDVAPERDVLATGAPRGGT